MTVDGGVLNITGQFYLYDSGEINVSAGLVNMNSAYGTGTITVNVSGTGEAHFGVSQEVEALIGTAATGTASFGDNVQFTWRIDDGDEEFVGAIVGGSKAEIIKEGGDILTLGGSFAFSGLFTVNDGVLNMNPSNGSDEEYLTHAVVVSDGASVIFSATQALRALTLNGAATGEVADSGGHGGKLLTVGSLSIAEVSGSYTATLDLNDNALKIDYGTEPSPIAAIVAMVAQGYALAAWNGGGIESSAAATSGLAVGYGDGADGIVAGLGIDEILVMYCLPGDIDLSGGVDGTDVDFLLGYYVTEEGATWSTADITYDGAVNGNDVDLFLGYYGQSGP